MTVTVLVIEVTAAKVDAGFNSVLTEVFKVESEESSARPFVVPMFAVTEPDIGIAD